MSVADGQRLASELGAHMYLECSALTHDGVDAVFEEVVRCAHAHTQKASAKKRKKKGKRCVLQ